MIQRKIILGLFVLLFSLGSQALEDGTANYTNRVIEKSYSLGRLDRVISHSYDEARALTIWRNSAKANTMSKIIRQPDLGILNRISKFDKIIAYYSRLHSVEPNLTKAIIYVESAGKPWSVSPKGAKGLMQLMPITALAVGVQDIFDPEENIAGGTRFLRDMFDEFRSVGIGLWAYNAGPQAVREGYLPQETRRYISKVLSVKSYLDRGF